VLCGSSVHVLDRWQSGDEPKNLVGHFYMDALLACARQLAELPDEAAQSRLLHATAPLISASLVRERTSAVGQTSATSPV
jgi:hypothetical protein